MSVGYRKKCLDAKEARCELCGRTNNIEVHHIDGNRSNNSLDNLLPVCQHCHIGIHSGKQGYEEWTEKLREETFDPIGFRPSAFEVGEDALEWLRNLRSYFNDRRKYRLAIEFAYENRDEFEQYLREKEQENSE